MAGVADGEHGSRKTSPATPQSGVFVEIAKRGSAYRLYDPELEIEVSNPDLNEGFAALNGRRALVLEELDRAGFPRPARLAPAAGSFEQQAPPNWQPAGPRAPGWRPPRRSGRSLIGRLIILSALVLVLALVVGPVLRGIDAVQTGLARFKEATKSENLSRSASNALIDFAAVLKRITPARREEMKASVRTIVEELRPFAHELAPLIEAATTPGPAEGGSGARPAGPVPDAGSTPAGGQAPAEGRTDSQ